MDCNHGPKILELTQRCEQLEAEVVAALDAAADLRDPLEKITDYLKDQLALSLAEPTRQVVAGLADQIGGLYARKTEIEQGKSAEVAVVEQAIRERLASMLSEKADFEEIQRFMVASQVELEKTRADLPAALAAVCNELEQTEAAHAAAAAQLAVCEHNAEKLQTLHRSFAMVLAHLPSATSPEELDAWFAGLLLTQPPQAKEPAAVVAVEAEAVPPDEPPQAVPAKKASRAPELDQPSPLTTFQRHEGFLKACPLLALYPYEWDDQQEVLEQHGFKGRRMGKKQLRRYQLWLDNGGITPWWLITTLTNQAPRGDYQQALTFLASELKQRCQIAQTDAGLLAVDLYEILVLWHLLFRKGAGDKRDGAVRPEWVGRNVIAEWQRLGQKWSDEIAPPQTT